MANTVFRIKRSSIAGKVPNTSTLSVGELALNLTDRKLFSSDGSNVFETGANLTTLTVSTNTSVNNIIVTGGIYTNGTFGSTGQVLTTNGSAIYWGAGGGSANGILDVRQQYVGDGVTNTFSVTGGYRSNDLSVYLNGVLLRNGAEVSVSDGGTFTFTTAPANGALIDIVGVGTLYSNGISTTTSQQFTANGTANSFVISGGYIPNQIQVYLNGVKQIPGTDVIISSGNTVNFISTPANNFIVDVFGYQTSLYTGVNTAAQYTWTNTHTFNSNVNLNNTTLYVSNVTVNGTTLTVSSNVVFNSNISVTTIVANGTIGTNNQQLVSNGSGTYWLTPTLSNLNDVAANGATSGQFLQYSTALNKWINANPPVANTTYSTGYYGSYYDTTTHTIANTAQTSIITFNNTVEQNGITSGSNGTFLIAYAGAYNFQYSLQFLNSDSNSDTCTVWIRRNGTDVVESASEYSIPGTAHGGAGALIGSVNYVFTVAAGDNVQLVWATSSNTISIAQVPANTSPVYPASPGAIFTITPVSNIITRPAGSNTQIQFNDSGVANAVAGFTFDKTSNTVYVGNSIYINSTANAQVFSIDGNFIANATGLYHIGTVNAASYTVGSSFTANSTIVNAAGLSVVGQANVGANLNVTGSTVISGNLTVTGNVSLAGSTTWINATVITTNDLNLVLANNASTNALASNSGIIVGTSANLVYSATGQSWQSNVNFTPAANNLGIGNTSSLWNVYSNNIYTVSVNASSHTTGSGYGTSSGGAIVNTNTLAVGNSTANAVINATGMFIGNSSVNCVINSTSIYFNGVDYNPTTALAIAVALS
jgi:mucin-19